MTHPNAARLASPAAPTLALGDPSAAGRGKRLSRKQHSLRFFTKGAQRFRAKGNERGAEIYERAVDELRNSA